MSWKANLLLLFIYVVHGLGRLHADLALLARAGEAGGPQGTPGAQQPQPHSPTGNAQQAEQQHAPVHMALIILHANTVSALNHDLSPQS